MTTPGHTKETAHLTFSQREGLTPLPSQLQLGEISPELRSLLWASVYASLQRASRRVEGSAYSVYAGPWDKILEAWHVLVLHRPADEFSRQVRHLKEPLKNLFFQSEYSTVFDFLEFVMRHGSAPHGFAANIGGVLAHARAAYIVVDDRTIFPTASSEEGVVIAQAFEALSASPFAGAKSHLVAAGAQLNQGAYAASIRESISAVESMSRALVPGATALGTALAELEKQGQLHPALKRGFGALYGFTCEEQGIRHPLLEKGEAQVDREDAVFMIGACAAFLSYLANKGRRAGLIK